jgi:hypothetical protein
MMKSFKFSKSDVVIDPVELVNELVKLINGLAADQRKATNPIWTLKVKEFLYEIGNKRKVEVLYSDSKKGVSEYLLDVIWWCRRNSGKRRVEFLALAAEVEWSGWGPAKGALRDDWVKNRVGEDFGKLTIVKCPLKLMVFCTDECGAGKSHQSMQKIVFAEIDRYLKPYSHHIPGEHYIFIDVATDGNVFAWIRKVSPNGVLGRLEKVPTTISKANYMNRIKQAQAEVRRYIPAGSRLSEELIAERREEAKRES